MSFIFDLIRIPFGFVIKWLYALTSNYFVAILLFTVVSKLVMFPLGIKQQKNSQKQAKLRPKENIIRKKYAGRTDRATQMKLNTEIQELYQKENFSPFGGCLPMLVQMLVLLAVYAVVRSPLTYTAMLPTQNGFNTAESVKQTVAVMVYEEDAARSEEERQVPNYVMVNKKYSETEFWDALKAGKYNLYSEVNILNYIKDNPDKFIAYYDAAQHHLQDGTAVSVTSGLEFSAQDIVEILPELELFDGFDLGSVPSLGALFGEAKLGVKLLLIVPVLTLITAYFGQALTRKFTYQPEVSAEMKSQNRMMNVFMPLFSLYISFQVPTAAGIYWMLSNALSPVQQIVLAKFYPIPEITPEEMKEAERLYSGKTKKKKTTTTTKRKSLVYDDDEDEVAVPAKPAKTAIKEKKNPEGQSVIEKAPLKDDE